MHIGEKLIYLLLLGPFLVGFLSPVVSSTFRLKLSVILITGIIAIVILNLLFLFPYKDSLAGFGWFTFSLVSTSLSFLLGGILGKDLGYLLRRLESTFAIRALYLVVALSFIALATSLTGIAPLDSLREASGIILGSAIWLIGALLGSDLKDEVREHSVYILFSLLMVISLILTMIMAISKNLSSFFSFFYQKDVFASFLLLTSPFTLAKLLEEIISERGLNLKVVMYLLAYFIALTTLIFTYSRASLLALFLASPLYIRYIYERLRKAGFPLKNLVRLGIASLVIFSLILATTALRLKLSGRDPVATLRTKVSNAVRISDTSTLARLSFWSAAWDLFKRRPLMGYGLYCYSYVYSDYQFSFLFYSKDPHNYYLQLLAETGILGFLSFVLLLGSTLYFLFRKLNRDLPGALSTPQGRLSAILMIAIFQEAIRLVFDVDFKFFVMLFVFFLLLGLSAGIIKLDERASFRLDLKAIGVMWLTLALMISLFAFPNFRLTLEGRKLGEIHLSGNAREDLERFDRLINSLRLPRAFAPYNHRFHLSLMKFFLNLKEEVPSITSQELKVKITDKILARLQTELKEVEKWAPKVLAGKLYYSITLLSFKRYREAFKVAYSIIRIDPYNLPLAYQIALVALRRGFNENYSLRWAKVILNTFPPEEAKLLMPVKQPDYAEVISSACELLYLKNGDYSLLKRCLCDGDPISGTPSELVRIALVEAEKRGDQDLILKLSRYLFLKGEDIIDKLLGVYYYAYSLKLRGEESKAEEILARFRLLLQELYFQGEISKEIYLELNGKVNRLTSE